MKAHLYIYLPARPHLHPPRPPLSVFIHPTMHSFTIDTSTQVSIAEGASRVPLS